MFSFHLTRSMKCIGIPLQLKPPLILAGGRGRKVDYPLRRFFQWITLTPKFDKNGIKSWKIVKNKLPIDENSLEVNCLWTRIDDKKDIQFRVESWKINSKKMKKQYFRLIILYKWTETLFSYLFLNYPKPFFANYLLLRKCASTGMQSISDFPTFLFARYSCSPLTQFVATSIVLYRHSQKHVVSLPNDLLDILMMSRHHRSWIIACKIALT